jgi:hypothetical protein
VRLVGVTEDLRLPAGQRGEHRLVAEVDRLHAAAGAEVVRRPADGELDASRGAVDQRGGHPRADAALAGVGPERAVPGQGPAVDRGAVGVDVLQDHEPGAGRLRRGEDAGLQAGELLGPPVVGGPEHLVDDPRPLRRGGGEARVARVAADHLDAGRHAGAPAAVHDAHAGLPAVDDVPGRVLPADADRRPGTC